jgi:hypothetical protein
VVQDGDIIHALYLVADRDRVENIFETGPEGPS